MLLPDLPAVISGNHVMVALAALGLDSLEPRIIHRLEIHPTCVRVEVFRRNEDDQLPVGRGPRGEVDSPGALDITIPVRWEAKK
jgi:hypothetical protein